MKWLILVLISSLLLMGCISMSTSTGSQAKTKAEAEAGVQTSQSASSTEDAELTTGEMSIEIKGDDGQAIATIKTAPTTARSGSKTIQKTDADSVAKASAEASAKATSKQIKSLWWIGVILLLAAAFTVVSRVPSLLKFVKKILV